MEQSFGQLLAHALESCHMSKTNFSKQTSILRNLLNRMLRDEAYPSVESFARIHGIINEHLPKEEANALVDDMMAAVRSDPRFEQRRERRSQMGTLRYERLRRRTHTPSRGSVVPTGHDMRSKGQI